MSTINRRVAKGILAALLWIVIGGSASAYDCRAGSPQVVQAIRDATTRGSGGGAATAYCGAVNVKRALIWSVLQCLNNDPTLGAVHRTQLQQLLEDTRRGVKSDMRGFIQLGGGTCNCWSSICVE